MWASLSRQGKLLFLCVWMGLLLWVLEAFTVVDGKVLDLLFALIVGYYWYPFDDLDLSEWFL
ncbi:hypothetical protein P280DRAFT_470766 [Massarina eburnea CBS 473.64]|uniref:Uncharacterized protein n=1 Tax=Massarina eburnea CBS 473.64 TaxID=1395130 RepID=A0A6A6RYW7_9PLEO|nr:hypothetical protein P280DRAFT_470766 [Massarina eburnea CBS 473.64]